MVHKKQQQRTVTGNNDRTKEGDTNKKKAKQLHGSQMIK